MPFVSEFEGIQTVASFLDYFDFMRPNGTVPVQLDFALADYLTGDMRGYETALSYVESILANHEESGWPLMGQSLPGFANNSIWTRSVSAGSSNVGATKMSSGLVSRCRSEPK
ncbi:hypothetical protein [Tardiphaga sp.]|uniref:hypothetical protein n=1 Tax=Tardiphaga sp. TaxID=1926292 RepID=UPI0025E3676D|nr:hypothetical protein [Tardiphaga sp.]